MTEPDLVEYGSSGGADLFGPEPGSDPLAYYTCPDPGADMFTAAGPELAAKWHAFSTGLAHQAQGDFASLQPYLDRHVEDLGLGFRVTGDEQERPWPLNPMPLLIDSAQWTQIEAGLVQRAHLLEAVIADIYGPQRLVADGHLPGAVVSGSGHFARRMTGMKPPGGHFLHICAIDLARGPTGEWRVLSDRVRLPVGIGYALQNRLAVARATGGLLAMIGTRRHAGFFDSLRLGIAANCERADPRIGLLTAGRFNQSYAEQAQLARQLGFSLVEGQDLTVHEGKLFVRTIAGLKRIDALWRWINTRDIDPLNFDARSRIGIPNLVDTLGQGMVLANWPGVGVVESRAMPAFLPRLAREILGEPLKLPNAATWWCGSEREKAHVLANLDNLVISSAFHQKIPGLPDGRTRLGSSLSGEERAGIERAMQIRPMDYTAQEIVNISTTPALIDGRFEPRGFIVRAFLARDEHGEWRVMPGGFARISKEGQLRTSLMGLGDISADICIVDKGPPDKRLAQPDMATPAIRREQGVLPSQAADNLYWMGRYAERLSQTVRVIRTLIEQVSIAGERAEAETAVSRLADMLRALGAVPQASIKWQPSMLASVALGDAEQAGSVRHLLESERQVAMLLRDRLTRDGWRTLQYEVPGYVRGDLDSMYHACDILVERSAAFVQLASGGLSRGPARHFLMMGICIERASLILQAARALVPGKASPEDLLALLDLVDGQTLYHSRYMTTPFIAPVFDMVLLDPMQPQGLAFQIDRIEEHLAALPVLEDNGMPEAPLRLARQLRARLEGIDAAQVTAETIDAWCRDVSDLSNKIGERYFLQQAAPVSEDRTSFLA